MPIDQINASGSPSIQTLTLNETQQKQHLSTLLTQNIKNIAPSPETLPRGHRRSNAVHYQLETQLNWRANNSNSALVSKSTTSFVDKLSGEKFKL